MLEDSASSQSPWAEGKLVCQAFALAGLGNEALGRKEPQKCELVSSGAFCTLCKDGSKVQLQGLAGAFTALLRDG